VTEDGRGIAVAVGAGVAAPGADDGRAGLTDAGGGGVGLGVVVAAAGAGRDPGAATAPTPRFPLSTRGVSFLSAETSRGAAEESGTTRLGSEGSVPTGY